jgi:hypothetical protein
MLATSSVYKGNLLGLSSLWLHECHRVWRDSFIREEDIDRYNGFIANVIRNDLAVTLKTSKANDKKIKILLRKTRR